MLLFHLFHFNVLTFFGLDVGLQCTGRLGDEFELQLVIYFTRNSNHSSICRLQVPSIQVAGSEV